MAKDPAILWYFGDWYSGTMTLTRHQKGCYMDLLCAQFNSGPLSLEEIKTILGGDFATWGVLSKKFKHDAESGLFSNARLESERLRRRTFVESRRNNLKGKVHMEHHMRDHMEDHMENENRNENKDINKIREGDARGRGGFVRPNLAEVQAYCEERGNHLNAQTFLDHYDSNGWKVGKNTMKDWRAAIRTWERNEDFRRHDHPKKDGMDRLRSLVISGGGRE